VVGSTVIAPMALASLHAKLSSYGDESREWTNCRLVSAAPAALCFIFEQSAVEDFELVWVMQDHFLVFHVDETLETKLAEQAADGFA
jgi:hypothetical protein